MLIKGLTVMGCRAGESLRRAAPRDRARATIAAERSAAMRRWARDGLFRPHVGVEAAAPEFKAAFEAVRRREVVGKAVVRFGGGGAGGEWEQELSAWRRWRAKRKARL